MGSAVTVCRVDGLLAGGDQLRPHDCQDHHVGARPHPGAGRAPPGAGPDAGACPPRAPPHALSLQRLAQCPGLTHCTLCAARRARVQVAGLPTNLAYLRRLAEHPAFIDCELDTGFVKRHAGEEQCRRGRPAPLKTPAVVVVRRVVLSVVRVRPHPVPWAACADVLLAPQLVTPTAAALAAVARHLLQARAAARLMRAACHHTTRSIFPAVRC